MTIMGQIAPSPGITLIKGGMSLQTHEILPLNPEEYIPRDIFQIFFYFGHTFVKSVQGVQDVSLNIMDMSSIHSIFITKRNQVIQFR